MSGTKLSFALGAKKPAKVNKKEEEAKKKKEEDELAAVYSEFQSSFAAPTPVAPSAGASGAAPPAKKAKPGLPGSAVASLFADDLEEDEEARRREEEALRAKNRPRAVDALLEELKGRQQARQDILDAKKEGRTFDTREARDLFAGQRIVPEGDPNTTNICVTNLHEGVNEEVLMREFGRWGALASVKIMWPWNEEERKRGWNTGFVAFMRREDAEKAVLHLQGVRLFEKELKLGWSKAVSLPLEPIWPPPASASGAAAAAADPSSSAAAAAPGGAARGGAEWEAELVQRGMSSRRNIRGAAIPPPQSTSGIAYEDENGQRKIVPVGPDIEVKAPSDPRLAFMIDQLALLVMDEGPAAEALVRERASWMKEMEWLRDKHRREHIYYRWRLYSLAQGDSLRAWRVEPFVMVAGGQRWIPPPQMRVVETKQLTTAQRKALSELQGGNPGSGLAGGIEGDRPLSDHQKEVLGDLLTKISTARTDVRRALVFVLDSSESAPEACACMRDNICDAGTKPAAAIGTLFLMSDILHNCQQRIKNATLLRRCIEDVLPESIEALNKLLRSAESRMLQEAIRRHVLRVLRAWRERFLLSDDMTRGLTTAFLRARDLPSQEDCARHPLYSDLSALSDADLAQRCKSSGLSREGGRESQLARLIYLRRHLDGELDTADERAAVEVAARDQELPSFAELSGSAPAPAPGNGLSDLSLGNRSSGPVAGGTSRESERNDAPSDAAAPPQGRSRWDMFDEDDLGPAAGLGSGSDGAAPGSASRGQAGLGAAAAGGGSGLNGRGGASRDMDASAPGGPGSEERGRSRSRWA